MLALSLVNSPHYNRYHHRLKSSRIRISELICSTPVFPSVAESHCGKSAQIIMESCRGRLWWWAACHAPDETSLLGMIITDRYSLLRNAMRLSCYQQISVSDSTMGDSWTADLESAHRETISSIIYILISSVPVHAAIYLPFRNTD